MKKDKYLRARGGTAEMIDISCARCQEVVLHYQKDGKGQLLRCYLNRIEGPPEYEAIGRNDSVKEPKDMPLLRCKCGNLLGTPMRHRDGRLAFRLIRGNFQRRRSSDAR